MHQYVVGLGAGVPVGVIYSLLNVRSPAPPIIALVGLLGILVGEQLVPLARRLLSGQTLTCEVLHEQCAAHLFGPLPSGSTPTASQRAIAGEPRS